MTGERERPPRLRGPTARRGSATHATQATRRGRERARQRRSHRAAGRRRRRRDQDGARPSVRRRAARAGERNTAVPKAIAAPTSPVTKDRIRATDHRCQRVRPRALRTGSSSDSRSIWRAMSWPTTRRAVRPAKPASSQRAVLGDRSRARRPWPVQRRSRWGLPCRASRAGWRPRRRCCLGLVRTATSSKAAGRSP